MSDEARIAALLDRIDIIDRKHAYIRAADACDPDRMVERFTDADFVALYDPTGPPILGKDAVRDWYAKRLATVVSSSHHVSNIEIEFTDPDTARLRCYLYSWQRFADHPAVGDRHRWARYIDSWVRRDGEWYQQSLTCLVAGEHCDDAEPRQGEYFGWDERYRP